MLDCISWWRVWLQRERLNSVFRSRWVRMLWRSSAGRRVMDILMFQFQYISPDIETRSVCGVGEPMLGLRCSRRSSLSDDGLSAHDLR